MATDDPAVTIRYGNRMKLSLDPAARVHVIRAYVPGELRVGETVHRASLILTAEQVVTGWRPATAADLRAEDVAAILALRPSVVLLGTGAHQVFPDRSALAPFYAARVGFEVMDTRAACRTFNVLVAEGRDVAAALIL